MAISNYSELKDAVTDWMDRSDISGKAADIITLAEARLNRELKFVEADVSLTGTSSSRRIDVSAYNVSEGVGLWLTTYTDDEWIPLRPDGSFDYTDTAGEPNFAALDDNNDYLDFNRPLDSAHTFRFRYRGRFALSDEATTNQLLTDHPDVYLAACLVWGGIYVKDSPQAASMKVLLDEFIGEADHYLSQDNRGQLSVDEALYASVGRRYDNSELL